MPEYVFGLFLILVLVISALIGLKRGFVRSIAGLAEYIVAFFVANRFYTFVADIVVRIPFLAKLKTDVDMPEIDSGKGFFEKLKAIIEHLINTALNSGDAEAEANAIINNYIADVVSKAIAFVVLFFVSLLILKLIVYLIDKFCDLPLLKATNKTLGVLFGLFCGMFVTWFLANLFVNTLLPIFIDKWPDVFSYALGENVIVRFFMRFSPIALIMYLINMISSIGVK